MVCVLKHRPFKYNQKTVGDGRTDLVDWASWPWFWAWLNFQAEKKGHLENCHLNFPKEQKCFSWDLILLFAKILLKLSQQPCCLIFKFALCIAWRKNRVHQHLVWRSSIKKSSKIPSHWICQKFGWSNLSPSEYPLTQKVFRKSSKIWFTFIIFYPLKKQYSSQSTIIPCPMYGVTKYSKRIEISMV